MRLQLSPPSRDRLILHLLVLTLPFLFVPLADRLLPPLAPPPVVFWSEAEAAKPSISVSRDDILASPMYLDSHP
jgi:hypothetical protein